MTIKQLKLSTSSQMHENFPLLTNKLVFLSLILLFLANLTIEILDKVEEYSLIVFSKPNYNFYKCSIWTHQPSRALSRIQMR